MQDGAFQMLCRSCLRSGHVGGAAAPVACPSCHSTDIRSGRELFGLAIAHVDCDAFYAAVEKRDNPDIRDRPVSVGGRERGVVAAACYIARRFGVRSAMPTWQALKRCPDAVVIRPRMDHYVSVSREIRARMLALTPLIQPLSIDEAFLDLAGTEALHGCTPAESLVRLQRAIREEVGITVSIGLSGTKSLAKMASDRDKPDGFFAIDMAGAAAWLAPQPVSVLFGLGKTAVGRLNEAGITRCGDLVAARPQELTAILGRGAPTIRDLAAGIDPRPVTPDREAKSISSETTFISDLSTQAELEAELEMLCLKVSARMKSQGLAGGRVTLKLKRPDHSLLTRSRALGERTDKAHTLFAIGRELLARETGPGRRYRLLGIGADQLGPPDGQSLLDIADEGGRRRDDLEAAIDDLHARMGRESLQSGRMFTRRHRPEDDPTRQRASLDRVDDEDDQSGSPT
ncbi:MAG: DNA polymerase IV [Rhodobiaceae bacterium]